MILVDVLLLKEPDPFIFPDPQHFFRTIRWPVDTRDGEDARGRHSTGVAHILKPNTKKKFFGGLLFILQMNFKG